MRTASNPPSEYMAKRITDIQDRRRRSWKILIFHHNGRLQFSSLKCWDSTEIPSGTMSVDITTLGTLCDTAVGRLVTCKRWNCQQSYFWSCPFSLHLLLNWQPVYTFIMSKGNICPWYGHVIMIFLWFCHFRFFKVLDLSSLFIRWIFSCQVNHSKKSLVSNLSF